MSKAKTTKHREATSTEHREILELLPTFLNGTLGDEESLMVAEHLETCPGCVKELEDFRALQRGLLHLEPEFLASMVAEDRTSASVPSAQEDRRGFPLPGDGSIPEARKRERLWSWSTIAWPGIDRSQGRALLLAAVASFFFLVGFFLDRAIAKRDPFAPGLISFMPDRHLLMGATRGGEFHIELEYGQPYLRLQFNGNPVIPGTNPVAKFEKFRCELVREGKAVDTVEGSAVRETEVDFVAHRLESGTYTLIYYGISGHLSEIKIDEFTIHLTINRTEGRSIR